MRDHCSRLDPLSTHDAPLCLSSRVLWPLNISLRYSRSRNYQMSKTLTFFRVFFFKLSPQIYCRFKTEMAQSFRNKFLFSERNVQSGRFSFNHSHIGHYANAVFQASFEVQHFPPAASYFWLTFHWRKMTNFTIKYEMTGTAVWTHLIAPHPKVNYLSKN